MSVIQKIQNWGSTGRGLDHVTHFLILGPPLYLRNTAKARNLKFGVRIDYYEYYSKHAKLVEKRAWPTFKFRDHLNISGTAKDRNLEFGVQIDFDECYSKHAKLGDKSIVP